MVKLSIREQVGARYFFVLKPFLHLVNRWASRVGALLRGEAVYTGTGGHQIILRDEAFFYSSGKGGNQILLRVEYYITNGHQILLHPRNREAPDTFLQ